MVANKVYSFNTRIEGDVKETTQKTELSHKHRGGGCKNQRVSYKWRVSASRREVYPLHRFV
jgi:hypothetical protein